MRIRKITLMILYILVLFTSVNALYAQNYLQELQSASRVIAKDAVQSVVTVKVTSVVEVQNTGNWFDFNPFRKKEDPKSEKEEESQEYRQSGIGSGVIVRRDGNTYYVLTNAHVVQEADKIELVTYKNKELYARVVGKDTGRDIALLSFKSNEDFKVAKLGNSDNLLPGDFVFAIGSPHGFDFTVTFGIISAIQRDGPNKAQLSGSLTEYIQTDAAINRGNSGGPLVNVQGEVVGINTWIYTRTGQNSGVNFAVPINNAVSNVDTLIKHGDVDYGWLGVFYIDVSIDKMKSLTDVAHGAFIDQIYRDSPAYKAGLFPGDIITVVDGKKIIRGNSLLSFIADVKPGSRVSVVVIRDKKEKRIQIVLGKRGKVDKTDNARIWPGFSVMELTPAIRKNIGILNRKGVMVGNVLRKSAAANSGLQNSDIIEKVNKKSIRSIRDFYAELNKVDEGEILFRVNRGGSIFIVGIVK